MDACILSSQPQNNMHFTSRFYSLKYKKFIEMVQCYIVT